MKDLTEQQKRRLARWENYKEKEQIVIEEKKKLTNKKYAHLFNKD
jgi:hypothetical protein